MRKLYCKILSCILIFSLLTLMGCFKGSAPLTDMQQEKPIPEKEPIQIEKETEHEPEKEPKKTAENEAPENPPKPTVTMTEVDWSNYFDGINGSAVIYDPAENCYQIDILE